LEQQPGFFFGHPKRRCPGAKRRECDERAAREVYPNHLSNVPCPLPRRIERVCVSIASPLTRPSPNGRRVGIRIVTFEACSGFTHVTARRIAQPSGYPAEPLVSYQINRQLSGWNLPPLMIRAFGAHCH
jgi:hypothetical protein